jgi:hypothetical protein
MVVSVVASTWRVASITASRTIETKATAPMMPARRNESKERMMVPAMITNNGSADAIRMGSAARLGRRRSRKGCLPLPAGA